MKILVTGGAGFIGSHLSAALSRAGHKVHAIDNLIGGAWSNITSLDGGDRVTTTQLDLCVSKDLQRFFKKNAFDVIYHLAADATEGRSQFMPEFCTENNYMAYVRLLRAALATGFRRIVVFSSMAVYGAQMPPFYEEMPCKPEDIYGISKAAMEAATRVMSKVFGFEHVIIRPHNYYGVNQWLKSPYRNVIAIWINAALRGKTPYIYGDGQQKRAFSYIDDALPALVSCADAPISGQAINIGSKKEYTLNELSSIIKKFIPANFEYLPARPQEVKNAWCTTDKSERLLGYRDVTSLEDGVKAVIESIKKTGTVEPVYDNLELVNPSTPKTWTENLYK